MLIARLREGYVFLYTVIGLPYKNFCEESNWNILTESMAISWTLIAFWEVGYNRPVYTKRKLSYKNTQNCRSR